MPACRGQFLISRAVNFNSVGTEMGLRLFSCCLGHSLPLKDSQLSFPGKVYLLFSGKAVFENLSLFSAHNCMISLSFSVAIWPYLPLRSLQGSVCSQLGTCCLLVPSHLGMACPSACRSVCLKSIQLLLFLCLSALLPWFGLSARPTELVKMGLLKIVDFFS